MKLQGFFSMNEIISPGVPSVVLLNNFDLNTGLVVNAGKYYNEIEPYT